MATLAQNNATALAATAELLRKAQAENARLREALEHIADVIQGGDKLESLEGWAREIVDQAHAALGSKP